MLHSEIDKLLEIMSILRDPQKGCAWDLAQTPQSIAPYTIEEAYEVADAIDRNDTSDLKDELGDLLLQIIFQSQMAKEKQLFAFEDIVQTLIAKLIRRHPHVFDREGNPVPESLRQNDISNINAKWDKIKEIEQNSRKSDNHNVHEIDIAVPNNLPALTRAAKVSRKAAGYGFDWIDSRDILEKIREETVEIEEALECGNREEITEEIGDLLFAVANLARHLGVDSEEALRQGTRKFERRFHAMVARLTSQGIPLELDNLEHMEAAWQAIKQIEKSSP